jgi:dTDP-4-amino-4,6-dideoxygalactose transaminase
MGPYIRVDPGFVQRQEQAPDPLATLMFVLPPRSVPPHPPILDRDVMRAIATPRGLHARSPEALAAEVVTAASRSEGVWVPDAAEALAAALQRRLGSDAVVAAPVFGRSDLGPALASRFKMIWMDPEQGRLDPGADDVSRAIGRGARAVIASPIVGQGGSMRAVEEACRAADVILAVDARWSPGSRVGDRVIGDFGDLVLLPVDGEPGPAAVWGAILAGKGSVAATDPAIVNGRAPGHALSVLVHSLRDEPRLRRFLPPPAPSKRRETKTGRPPGWACAAASVRLAQAAQRATQRALHARTLRAHCGNVEGIELVNDPPGCQAAGGTFPLLVDRRDALAEALRTRGVPVLDAGLGPLRPDEKLGWGARDLAQRLLLLPLLPFYRRADLVFVGEQLRLAAYASGTSK